MRKIKLICSVKTTTKDRCSQFFTDRPEFHVPYIVVVFNDVQRSKKGIQNTFVPGRFKDYVKNYGALDGVYYFDSPFNISDEFFKAHIYSFNILLCESIWEFLGLQKGLLEPEIDEYLVESWYDEGESQYDSSWKEDEILDSWL